MNRFALFFSVAVPLIGSCSFVRDFDEFSASCPAGTGDCDTAVLGCETDITSSNQNCGACGAVCGPTDYCDGSSCQRYTATAGYSAYQTDVYQGVPYIAAAANGGVFAAFTHGTPLNIAGLSLPATDYISSIVRFNGLGQLNFAVSMTGPGFDSINDLEQTSYGVVAAGYFYSCTLDLGSSSGAGASVQNTEIDASDNVASTTDSVLWALNEDGTYRWHTRVGGAGYTFVNAVTTDGQGNVYAAGYFTGGQLYFGTSATNRHEGLASGIFVAKFLENGAYAWSKAIDASSALISSIQADANGNVYIFSTISGTHTINGTVSNSVNPIPRILAVTGTAGIGNVLWFRGYPGAEPSSDAGDSIDIIPGATASEDRMFIAFDAGTDSAALGSITIRKGSTIAEIDRSNGEPIRAFWVADDAQPFGLTHDVDGNLVVSLYVDDMSLTTIDLLDRTFSYSGFGDWDSYLLGMTPEGGYLFSRHFGTAGRERPENTVTTGDGQVYVSTRLNANFDFDSVHLVRESTQQNAAIIRFSPTSVLPL